MAQDTDHWFKRVLPWLWTVVALIIAWVLVDAAVDKLLGDPAALKPFEEAGIPIWLAYLTSVGEIVGAIFLVIVYTRLYAGLLVTVIMFGAAVVNLLNGHPDYLPINVALIVGSLVLAWQGRAHAWLLPERMH